MTQTKNQMTRIWVMTHRLGTTVLDRFGKSHLLINQCLLTIYSINSTTIYLLIFLHFLILLIWHYLIRLIFVHPSLLLSTELILSIWFNIEIVNQRQLLRRLKHKYASSKLDSNHIAFKVYRWLYKKKLLSTKSPYFTYMLGS